MITEVKLWDFLNDLRLGKYDTENYKLEAYGIPDCVSLNLVDVSKNITLYLSLYKSSSYKYVEHKFLGLYWETKKKLKKNAPAYALISYTVPVKSTKVDISDDLYNSFSTYILEQKEKIKLVEDSNRETAFGL